MRLLLLALAFVCVARPGFADPQLSQVKSTLRQLNRRKNDAKREHLKQVLKEQSLLKQLDALQLHVDASRRDWQTDEHNLTIDENRLATLQRLSGQCQDEVATNRALLGRALAIIYRSGPMGEAGFLFSSKDPAMMMSRYRFLKELAKNNAARVTQTRERLNQFDEFAREYKVRELEHQNLMASAEAHRLVAEHQQRSRSTLLNGIRRKKSQTERLLKELDASAQNLESKMAEMLEAQRAAEQQQQEEQHSSGEAVELDTGPSQMGRPHSLPWPVRGPLLSRFGRQMNMKFHTAVFNRGIEIAAPLGSPVIAVADGTARFADHFDGYGQLVILDHGGNYFTVYGYNSQLLVHEGEKVHRGEEIAEVGDASTLGRPSLYFEIRSFDKAVNPMAWLSR